MDDGVGYTLDVIGGVPGPICDLFCREWQRENV